MFQEDDDMKLKNKFSLRSGYALLMVLTVICASLIILGATMKRTTTVAIMNERNNELLTCQNAAEAAIEAVFARMQYDFQANGGPGAVNNNLDTGYFYRNYYPGCSGDTPNIAYWDQFQFSDASGNLNHTYVQKISTYYGSLPQAYPGRSTANAPLYRIVSNARLRNSRSGVIGAVQVDVLLALVPLTTYAIFYNGLLEFSTCATMNVRGPVHSNTNIYVGAGGSSTLSFYSTVTSSGTITAPANNGSSWTGASSYNASNWRTYFYGTPSNYITRLPTVGLSINMTNTHSLIEIPAVPDATNISGAQRLYNQAQIVLMVGNSNVSMYIREPKIGLLAGADTAPTLLTTNFYPTNYYASNYVGVATMFNFLTVTNKFYDKREGKTNLTTQIDVGLYKLWIATNSAVASKIKASDGFYPTILFVTDNRTTNQYQRGVVRLTNGIAPPSNNKQGFSVATPNPLYVWGNPTPPRRCPARSCVTH
jgi:hypothetical protein